MRLTLDTHCLTALQNGGDEAVPIRALISKDLPPDIDGLAAHIRSGHDIFVTGDEHFLRNARRNPLLTLGAKAILTPEQALAKVADKGLR